MVWIDYLVFNLIKNRDPNALGHDETRILMEIDHLNEKIPCTFSHHLFDPLFSIMELNTTQKHEIVFSFALY